MSRCYKIKNLFGSYIYNTITADEKAEVEEHIKSCQECAEDLRTQQETLKMIRIPQEINDNALQLNEDRFVGSVYRKIALESMKHRNQDTNLNKFVLQPAMATVAVVFIVALIVTRFDNAESPIQVLTPIASNTTIALPQIEETANPVQTDIAKGFVKEEPEKINPTAKVGRKVAKKVTENVAQVRPDFLLNEVKVANSRDWLMNADLINYSLGQPLRALSKYQMIVEHYPDTDAAKEAQKRINTILNSEFENHIEEVTFETESNSGI